MKDICISRFEKLLLLKIIKKVIVEGFEKDLSKLYELIYNQAVSHLSAFPNYSIDKYIIRCFNNCDLKIIKGGDNMEAYQERVMKEKEDLDIKIHKLGLFLYQNKVSEEETNLLEKQLTAMEEYSDVLRERIFLFGGEIE